MWLGDKYKRYNRHFKSTCGLLLTEIKLSLHNHNDSLTLLWGYRKNLYFVLFFFLPVFHCITPTQMGLWRETYLFPINLQNCMKDCIISLPTLAHPGHNPGWLLSLLLVWLTLFFFFPISNILKETLPFVISRETRSQEASEWRVSVYIITQCRPQYNTMSSSG